jgi:hypothetical protein
MDRHDPAGSALVCDLVTYYGKTRRLPDYLVLLGDTLASLDALAESPLTSLRSLQTEIRNSLGPAQVASTIEMLCTHFIEAAHSSEAAEPPKKKRKKEVAASTVRTTRGLALAFVASVALDTVAIPKPEREAVTTALRAVMQSEAVCGPLERLTRGGADGEGSEAIAALLLTRSTRSRAVELADETIKPNMDALVAGALPLLANSSTEPTLVIEIVRRRLRCPPHITSANPQLRTAIGTISDLSRSSTEAVCEALLGILDRSSTSWTGAIFGTTCEELPTACLHLLSYHIGTFECAPRRVLVGP